LARSNVGRLAGIRLVPPLHGTVFLACELASMPVAPLLIPVLPSF